MTEAEIKAAAQAAEDERLRARLQGRFNQLKPEDVLGFLLELLGVDDATLQRVFGISHEDIFGELGSNNYSGFSLSGPNGPLGMGKLSPQNRNGGTPLQREQLQGLSRDLTSATNGGRAAELARRFLGQHEVGNNGGALVQLVNGYTGDPWCGGFTHHVLSQTMPGVYSQGDFLRARSYMDVGTDCRAFHPRGQNYEAKPGDVIVFTRGGNSGQGHVGIVTGYDAATKTLTYVSGNDADAVRERQINMDNPPSRLLGITDSEAVARAKGIAIVPHNKQLDVSPPPNTSSAVVANRDNIVDAAHAIAMAGVRHTTQPPRGTASGSMVGVPPVSGLPQQVASAAVTASAAVRA